MSSQIEKTKIENVLNHLATDFFFEEFCDKGWDFSEEKVDIAKSWDGFLVVYPKITPKGRGNIVLHVKYPALTLSAELSPYDLKVKAFKGGKQFGDFYLPKP